MPLNLSNFPTLILHFSEFPSPDGEEHIRNWLASVWLWFRFLFGFGFVFGFGFGFGCGSVLFCLGSGLGLVLDRFGLHTRTLREKLHILMGSDHFSPKMNYPSVTLTRIFIIFCLDSLVSNIWFEFLLS